MTNPYKLRRWRPERENAPFASLILASRNSGKSHLIRTLWEKTWKTKFDIVAVFCGSEIDADFEDYLPGKLFFQKFNPRVIELLKEMQEQRVAAGNKPLRILIILDDCSETRERYEDELRSLYTRGRHWNCSVVFATQAIQLSDTVARNNSDFVIVGRQRGQGGREQIVDGFLKGLAEPADIPSDVTEKKFLFTLLKRNTTDYGFVVISTSDVNAEEFRDIVFSYRSPIESFTKPRKRKVDVVEEEPVIVISED